MENKDNENLETDKVRKSIINWSSYISLLLGFILIGFIAYLMIYKDFKGDDLSNLYIIVGILFLFGFLGNEFVDIFKNTITKKVEEKVNNYLEDNKSLIEEKTKKILENYKIDLVNNIEESLKDYQENLKEKFEENGNDNIPILNSNINLDTNDEDNNKVNDLTVIVASGGSNDWNIKNRAYFHPKTRSFREGTKYLGFYYKGEVTGYGKISKIEDKDKIEKLIESVKQDIGYNDLSFEKHDFFSCEKGFKEVSIDWKTLGRTPVMSKQYISLSELLSNK